MLYSRCTSIYNFGINTYPRHIRRRSNLDNIFREKKCVLWAGKYSNSAVFSGVQVNYIRLELHVASPENFGLLLVSLSALSVRFCISASFGLAVPCVLRFSGK